MKVGVVATRHACEQAQLRHPDDFPAGTARATVRRVIEREVAQAIPAGRVGHELDGYSLDKRGGERGGNALLCWTSTLRRVYVVTRKTTYLGTLWTVVTVLPPAISEEEAAA